MGSEIFTEFHVQADPPHGWAVAKLPPADPIAIRYLWMAYYGEHKIKGEVSGEAIGGAHMNLSVATADLAIDRAKEEHQFLVDNADKLASRTL